MVNGDPAIMATWTSNTDESGNACIGLTIPVDVQTTIHTLFVGLTFARIRKR